MNTVNDVVAPLSRNVGCFNFHEQIMYTWKSPEASLQLELSDFSFRFFFLKREWNSYVPWDVACMWAARHT